ncbi:MAG: phytanoyl-CoA dioxygenase family protein [Gemmatimonadota bacterium]|nr:phytanoyl-CoA dioxygenase family protein [Gemmatimonadota bacterium]
METTTVKIDPKEEIGFMTVDETDFAAFSLSEQIRHLEMEGYVLMPDVLDAEHIAALKAELKDLPMTHKDYSKAQTVHHEPQCTSRLVAELIGYPPIAEFLKALMGPDIVFTHGLFTRTLSGSPGISMHTDGQPFGSSIFGFEGSSPRLLRVLYYLDDLPPERAPFRLIPRSHLSFHAQANPYVRYVSHPQEITLCAKAGSVVMIPALLFHGTHPNRDLAPRELIQFGYRPAWAGPVQPMDDWDPEWVSPSRSTAA